MPTRKKLLLLFNFGSLGGYIRGWTIVKFYSVKGR